MCIKQGCFVPGDTTVVDAEAALVLLLRCQSKGDFLSGVRRAVNDCCASQADAALLSGLPQVKMIAVKE